MTQDLLPGRLIFGPNQSTIAQDAASLALALTAFGLSLPAVPESGPVAPLTLTAALLAGIDVT